LDEVANIAPIQDLPELASEAGGQGLRTVAVLQNLPQAASRWGKERAYGMLSTFGQVIVLGGTRDPETLDTISKLLGSESRWVPSVSQSVSSGQYSGGTTQQVSYAKQDFPVATPAEISQIPQGQLLVFDSRGYHFYGLSTYFGSRPWPTVFSRVQRVGWVRGPVSELGQRNAALDRSILAGPALLSSTKPVTVAGGMMSMNLNMADFDKLEKADLSEAYIAYLQAQAQKGEDAESVDEWMSKPVIVDHSTNTVIMLGAIVMKGDDFMRLHEHGMNQRYLDELADKLEAGEEVDPGYWKVDNWLRRQQGGRQ